MKAYKICILLLISILISSVLQAEENQITIDLSEYVQVQILLDQAGFSPGEIDGRAGYNTLKALKAFQQVKGLDVTGIADEPTMEALGSWRHELLVEYRILEEDLKGPFVRIPKDFMEKARLNKLYFSSPEEAIAEKFHVAPDLLRELNPESDFSIGQHIIVPNVRTDIPVVQGGNLVVTVSGITSDVTVRLNGHIIFYAPISHGGDRDPLPIGKRKVNGVIKNPHYKYDPKLFWDADPSHTPAVIAPGPNNPVGAVWIALDLQHYGLHGTPEPSSIGYAHSHGCVRLTNWDAQRLATIVKAGTEVVFQ